MIKLVSNANSNLAQFIKMPSVNQVFSDVCEEYAKGNEVTFSISIQVLITKVGNLMSRISTKSVNVSYYSKARDYLCMTVLENQNLKQRMLKLNINNAGNQGKHTLANPSIRMDDVVRVYNEMINDINSKYNLSSILSLIVTRKLNNTNQHSSYPPKQNQQPVQPSKSQNQPSKPSQPPKPANPFKSKSKDPFFTLSVELKKGDGHFQKGLIRKIDMFNIEIDINVTPKQQVKKPSSIVIELYLNGKLWTRERLYSDLQQRLSYDLEGKGGKVSAKVTMKYHPHLLATKTLECSESRQY